MLSSLFLQVGVEQDANALRGSLQKRAMLARIQNNKYFIAANFYNSENIMSDFFRELTHLIDNLGRDRCFVSIWENGSTDNTKHMLRDFEKLLNKLKVQNRIITENASLIQLCQEAGADECLTPHMFARGVRDATASTRIAMMALFRNKPLEPLRQLSSLVREENPITESGASSVNAFFGSNAHLDQTKVLFFNDIYFSYQDIVKLIDTNRMDYDLACALDFQNLKLYDLWVLRDINGLVLNPWFPFFWDMPSFFKIVSGTPVQVYSCWNGVVVFDASVLSNRSGHMIKFRSWKDGEKRSPIPAANRFSEEDMHKYDSNTFNFPHCTASECQLFSKDLWESGRTKIFVNPSVKVDYDITQRYLRILLSPLVNFASGLIWILKGQKYVEETHKYAELQRSSSTRIPPINVRCGIDYSKEN